MRLCDFGLSRLHAIVENDAYNSHESLTRNPWISTGFTATSFGGTLRYLAPEQMLSDCGGPTAETDTYAFACTCAEVCSSSR